MHDIENFSEVKKTEKTVKYHEILCPLTKDSIIVSNCNSCQHCQKMKGMNLSGRSLTSLICLYNSNKEGEFQ